MFDIEDVFQSPSGVQIGCFVTSKYSIVNLSFNHQAVYRLVDDIFLRFFILGFSFNHQAVYRLVVYDMAKIGNTMKFQSPSGVQIGWVRLVRLEHAVLVSITKRCTDWLNMTELRNYLTHSFNHQAVYRLVGQTIQLNFHVVTVSITKRCTDWLILIKI